MTAPVAGGTTLLGIVRALDDAAVPAADVRSAPRRSTTLPSSRRTQEAA